MKKIKGLKNFSFYLIGDLFVKGLMFITLPIFTRILTLEDYGKLSVLNSLLGILMVFFSLNMQNVISNSYMHKEKNFNQVLGNSLSFLWGYHLCLFIFIYVFSNKIAETLKVNKLEILLITLICILLSYFNIYLNYLMATKNSSTYSKISSSSKIIETLLSIILIVYFLNHNKYLGKYYAQLIILAPLTTYTILKLIQKSEFKIDKKILKNNLIFALPLIPHVLSTSILAQSDRIILTQIKGSEATGLYSFAYNLGMAIIVLIMAWNNSWQPQFYEDLKEGKTKKIELELTKYLKIIFMVSIIIILFSEEVVNIIAPIQYQNSWKLVPIILLGNLSIFIYLVYSNYLFYKKKTFIIAFNTVISGILNIYLNYKLIPKYSYYGAALATLAAYFILIILHYIGAKRIIEHKIVSLKRLLKQYTVLILVSGLVIFLGRYKINIITLMVIKVSIFISYYFYLKITEKINQKKLLQQD